MGTSKISIIILDFLKAPQVVQNVKSALRQKGDFEVQIIVVDNSVNTRNAKQLDLLQKYKNVRVIINKKNEGYPRGNNIGAKFADGKFIAIVNPDIIWKDTNTLQKLFTHLKTNPQIGIIGPKQINPDDSIAMTVRAFPKFWIQIARRTFFRKLPVINNAVAHDEMQHLDYDKTQSVDWLQSSFFMMRKDFWDTLGGFDESYFLFMADAEICWQSWKKKKQVCYYPEAKVYADGIRLSEGGFKALFSSWVLRQHVKDSLRYSWKHFFEHKPK